MEKAQKGKGLRITWKTGTETKKTGIVLQESLGSVKENGNCASKTGLRNIAEKS